MTYVCVSNEIQFKIKISPLAKERYKKLQAEKQSECDEKNKNNNNGMSSEEKEEREKRRIEERERMIEDRRPTDKIKGKDKCNIQ